MSKRTTYIYFDASLKDGNVGIGIYNQKKNTGESIFFENTKLTVCQAETKALQLAIQYAINEKISKPMFFTDNLYVFDQGFPTEFEKSFDQEFKPRLFWIPRELNTEADKLSKGYKINEIMNIANTIKTKYTFNQKLNFLKKIARQKSDIDAIRLLETGEKDDYSFQLTEKNKIFFQLIKGCFAQDELSEYTKLRLQYIFRDITNVKDNQLERLIQERLGLVA
jgi:ribonuclease HI